MSGERQQALSKNKCKELIQDMLISNGHREMLKRLVQSRLAQSGWTYAMRTTYIDYIKQKGVENVNVSHMIAETVPAGVESFPDAVRKEIEDLLWNFATEFISVDETLLPPVDNENYFPEVFTYQSSDAKPEPGIGYNVPTPEIPLSRTPSPASIPRPLTPQPPIPILRPENTKHDGKDELLYEEEEEEEEQQQQHEQEEDEGRSSSNLDEHEDNDNEVDEPEDDEDLEVGTITNHNVESEEEELMDV
ncbi:histone chaperone ASF1 isoform X2 [Folsomia candida]|nr:histone chaperone ASF1 isoform X2 [Folsomia candida]